MRQGSTGVMPQNTTRNELYSRFGGSKRHGWSIRRLTQSTDLHVTATRKHDSRIAPSLIERDPERIDILLGDEGYDDRKADDLPVTTRFGHLTMLDRAS